MTKVLNNTFRNQTLSNAWCMHMMHMQSAIPKRPKHTYLLEQANQLLLPQSALACRPGYFLFLSVARSFNNALFHQDFLDLQNMHPSRLSLTRGEGREGWWGWGGSGLRGFLPLFPSYHSFPRRRPPRPLAPPDSGLRAQDGNIISLPPYGPGLVSRP